MQRDLVERAMAGDREAFSELGRHHRPDGNVWVTDLEDLELISLLTVPADIGALHWSQDGSKDWQRLAS